VTVCIAASCMYEGSSAVVLCCDWQGTKGSFIKSDDVDKIRIMGTGTGLISGSLTEAEELVAECDSAVLAFQKNAKEDSFDLDMNDYLKALRRAGEKRKADRVANHVAMALGLDPIEFWKNGKNYLSTSQHDELYDEIRKIDLGASLIIGSVTANDSVIIKVDRSGYVSWENNFSTIGSGSLIAQAFLCQYEWDEEIELTTCLHRVYSAKQAAEKDPQVGPTTSFEILHKDKRLDMTDIGWKKLKRITGKPREPKWTLVSGDLREDNDDDTSTGVQSN